jgi:hypothetical protein
MYTPQLVFQMTMRVATCRELTDDPGAVSALSNLYWLLEKGTTPVGVLLPWFPSPARKAREKATAGLFGMLYTYVELRRNAAVPSSDAFDVLISQGTPTEAIVGVCLTCQLRVCTCMIDATPVRPPHHLCWSHQHRHERCVPPIPHQLMDAPKPGVLGFTLHQYEY